MFSQEEENLQFKNELKTVIKSTSVISYFSLDKIKIPENWKEEIGHSQMLW